MGTYFIAEICPNGHVITDNIIEHPELHEEYCSKCGEATITKCSNCSASIRGEFYHPGWANLPYAKPAFCHNCGKAFPWTDRKISGAVELVKEGAELSTEELAQFEIDLSELTKDSPKVQAASIRFKKYMARAGNALSGSIRELIVDILSETAKKAIWGP